jgi:hypothetical protein
MECVESPLYDPTMLAAPGAEGVNLTPQEAVVPVPVKVQLVTLKLPAIPLSVKLTDPVGVVAPAVEVSVTVAVHVDTWFTSMGLEHETLTLVECLPGDSIADPALPLWLLSPEYVAVILCAPKVPGV